MNYETMTKKEIDTVYKSFHKLDSLRNALYTDSDMGDIYEVFKYFNRIKEIMGNFNTDVSFITCLMAKDYLCNQFALEYFDVSEKSQSAPGPDIELYTAEGKKIIAEIKSTIPYKNNDFGSQQIDSLRNDFSKLKNSSADYKYMFVTNESAYNILNKKYSAELDGIMLVLLERKKYNNEIKLSDFADDKMIEALFNNNIEDVLENAFKEAYKSTFGDSDNFIVNIEYSEDEDDILIRFFEEKEVVEDVYSEKSEIELEEAKIIRISSKIGDRLVIPFDKALLTKESVIIALKNIFQDINMLYENTKPSVSSPSSSIIPASSSSGSGFRPYYEEYKPYHHPGIKTKTEEEVDREYGAGYYDAGPNPFPFDSFSDEDDYGDDSWA
ncbi:MAG: NusA N-terminal domain-containing protein [Spirochaetales bacterium]|nr:NusA N-terminal domain-containing protein [Spirochaetales bacterium]MDY5914573.1 NusA N-terminal domain-containing protein [Treponema sp.]